MISYLRGEVLELGENYLTVDVHQIGYEVFVPARVLDHIHLHQEVRLHTYLHVREDAMQLFGFTEKDELRMFKLLIGVNGIGPKVGLGILSNLSANDIRFAVLSDDIKTITSAPGIGKKTAQKLILELKDKVSLEEAFETGIGQQPLVEETSQSGQSEAVQALTALGYSGAEALKAVKKVDITSDMDVEEILKLALKFLIN